MTLRHNLSRWICVLALAAGATAQRDAPVVLRGGLVIQQDPQAQTGAAVRMFESPTLDRFLRKAQECLGRDDHTGAIMVLQDVLEGNIRPDGAVEESETEKAEGGSSGGGLLVEEDDPTHAVFSNDQRLYRPVRRLCHELLAHLPDGGLELYREMYEVAAERDYQAAVAQRDLRGLEKTYNRYFATLNAGRALRDTGDLMMHSGRFRAAIQAYRTLLEVYPQENRARVPGLSDLYTELKIALCFAQMGETSKALEQLELLKGQYPDSSVRLQGELVAVGSLPEHPLFARREVQRVVASASDAPEVLRSLDDGLVPVWQFQYTDPEPYRRPTGSSKRSSRVPSGVANAVPWYNRHRPGGRVQFEGSQLVFMDHFRLRVHDLGSGLVQAQSEGADLPPAPRSGKARSRIPVYDYAAMRVASDARSFYCVVGPQGRASLPNMDPVLKNQLFAYDRASLSPLWSSKEWKTKDRNYDDVTFLATPTVFGQRLLVPILVQGAYALQGISSSDGEPLFRVHLHSGGTELARAPAVPAVVSAGTAYVLTNAGTLAAVDAFTGELHWVRRYERTHPYRPTRPSTRRSRSRNQLAMQQQFRSVTLTGFVPSDLVAIEGRVLFAPSDGQVMLCLDGASGEVLWVVTKPTGSNVHVLGHNSRFLYLGGDEITCVDLRTGVRLWNLGAPEAPWTGRGIVTEDRVVVPGTRAVYTLPAEGGEWRKSQLPSFSIGTEPEAPPANLYAHGPYMVACYEGGIEVFASLEALHELAQAATDPAERADLLVQAGDLMTAIDVLGPLSLDENRTKPERKKIARRTLALVRDVVLARASHAARTEALALHARTEPWFWSRDLRLQWQLLRIELFQTLRETDAVDRERDVLYEMMEGKR